MMRFLEKIRMFMYGRYGSDKLNIALLVLYLILCVINMFVRSYIMYIPMLLVIVLVFYRILSKNIYKRRIENEKFMYIWGRVSGFCKITVNRCREFKTHRYRKCPKCKAKLRLPRRKGTHTVECPRCHNDFRVTIRL